jgi:DNA-directed RNA polymerase beta' subunit
MQRVVKYYQKGLPFMEIELCETEIVSVSTTATDESILNYMFEKYNSDNRPDGKIRPSMSVGDIVSIDGIVYACQMQGWKQL